MHFSGQTSNLIFRFMALDDFKNRHIGPRDEETGIMLKQIGVESRDELIKKTSPNSILLDEPILPSRENGFLFLMRKSSILVFPNLVTGGALPDGKSPCSYQCPVWRH